jgi:CHRD domain-containing protein
VDPRQAPRGSATFTVTGQTIAYKVSVENLSSPYIGAHIHSGGPGVAGPVLVPLDLSAGSQGTASGEGNIDASAIKAKKTDGSAMTMDELIGMMRSGSTYINVHTKNNKPGEARGQIQE